ncbi:MAG: NIPSNAP family protein [Bryobacterales bacterium]|nr:NIPSNAP family protein [Bryobacterales bacterium]
MFRGLAVAVFLAAALPALHARVFEIRTYTTSQKMADVKALFRDHSVALFKKHGLEVIGYWVPQDPPRSQDTFIYMLAFPDRETAKDRWEAFHKDPEWLKVRAEFEAKHGKIVDKIESEFVEPTDFSPLK